MNRYIDRMFILLMLITQLTTTDTQHTSVGGSGNPTKGRKRIGLPKMRPVVDPIELSPLQKQMEQLRNTPGSRVLPVVQKNYNREEPPMKDRPTKVDLGIFITSFFSISEQTMDYMVSMYFRQQWREPRLAYPPVDNGKTTTIRLPDESWEKLWIPDTYFRNEKRAQFSKVTVNNRLMRLNSTGHVWYVSRITAKLSCPMRLEKFPLDTQTCPMQFESFSYTMDTLYFAWLPIPVDFNEDLELPQFRLVDVLLVDCSKNYTTGAYPCAEINFIIQRDIGFFVIQFFVPTILIVIISWVSFWINVDASPARVNLGLTTVLTTTTLSVSINESLPRVSYIKAIDIWMITCLVFVFAALLEYAFVNVTSRSGLGIRLRMPVFRRPARMPRMPLAHQGDNDSDYAAVAVDGTGSRDGPTTSAGACGNYAKSDELRHGGKTNSAQEPCLQAVTIPVTTTPTGRPMVDLEACKQRARRIDKFSRKFFPLAFVIFNIVYWSVYSKLAGPGYQLPPEGEYSHAPSPHL